MNKNPITPACENCAHVAQGELDPNNIGAPRPLQCRRFPPSPIGVNAPGGLAFIPVNPPVPPNGLCGEWESLD